MPSPAHLARPTNLARPAWTLALLALAGLITALDFTIVYVALPEIAADVGFSDHGLQWVVSSYAVVYGGLLLLGGRLADLLGRRRMFVLGMALYGAGSLLGGLATAPGPLIGARALQGVGGAILFPATLSLVNTLFTEGRSRTRALTVWAVSGAGGLSLGALLGGVLTSAFGWQAVFYVNVPLVVVAGPAAFALLPADAAWRGEREEHEGGKGRKGRERCEGQDGRKEHDGRDSAGAARPGFDFPGALTGTVGLTLLVFAIAQGPEWGWTDPQVLGAAGVALLLLAGFVAVESRTADPLLPPRLFTHRGLTAATGVILVFGLTLQAVPFFLTLWFQGEMGFSALRTGVAFLGPTLSITVGNLAGERLAGRLGVRRTLMVGFAVAALGAAVLATGMTNDSSYVGLLPGIVAFGLGTGIVFTTMWVAAASGVADAEQGAASGLASTALQFGSGAGLAVLVSVGGIRTAVAVVAVGALIGLPAALALPKAVRPPADPAGAGPVDPIGQPSSSSSSVRSPSACDVS
ncbi:MFS transporter [Embleya scabrispora]|uniref:MFS transporter n=1 Tax=Embleya scabrispora TaxID=159449 RepID=UPI0003816F54|nr:MFS transporter [Embleya scabrispora]MYS86307.1 MFS transporter [Streptomyces sp. SID5474]